MPGERSGTISYTIKWIEFGLLFFVFPMAYSFLFPQLPLLIILGVGVTCALLFLYFEGLFHRKVFFHWEPTFLQPIFARFLLFAVLSGFTVWYILPGKFLHLVYDNPGLMALILVLYPVLSVIPQELIFRTLYFERYAHLFPAEWMAVLVNAILFGLAHLLFGNWLAVVASAVLSFAISIHYLRHRSLLLAALEHALYGNFVFLVGIGEYFYRAPWS